MSNSGDGTHPGLPSMTTTPEHGDTQPQPLVNTSESRHMLTSPDS